MAATLRGSAMLKSLFAAVLLLHLCLVANAQDVFTPTPRVVIDGYSSKPYVDPADPVSLNTTVILMCRVVGVPSGRGQFVYEWTCPGGECNIGEGTHPNRRTLDDTIVVNIISLDDAGRYTCSVTQEDGDMVFSVGSSDFSLTVMGGNVFHSNNNLIPKNSVARNYTEFAPVEPRPVQFHCFAPGPNEVDTRWTDVSFPPSNEISISGDQNTSTVSVADPNVYLGGAFSCSTDREFIANFYLLTLRTGSLLSPVVVTAPNFVNNGSIAFGWSTVTAVERYVVSFRRTDLPAEVPSTYIDNFPNGVTNAAISSEELEAGITYELQVRALAVRTGSGATFLSDPLILTITTPDDVPTEPRQVTITRHFDNDTGIEINWLPPRVLNGDVSYVVQYSTDELFPVGSTTDIVHSGDELYENITNLEPGVQYYVRVVAVTTAGQMEGAVVEHMFAGPEPIPSPSPSATPTLSTSVMFTATDLEVEPTSTHPHSTSSTPAETSATNVEVTATPDSPPLTTVDNGPLNIIAVAIAVPIGVILIAVVITVGVVLIAVVYRRRRKVRTISGKHTPSNYTLENGAPSSQTKRTESFVVNPNAREAGYDTLNGYQTSLAGHSERAIDVEVPRNSSSSKANSGTRNVASGAKSAGGASTAAKSQPSSNAEDLYSKPDMAKKKKKMTVVKESELNVRDSATDTSSGSFTMSGAESSPSVSMWNVPDDDRPSSVA